MNIHWLAFVGARRGSKQTRHDVLDLSGAVVARNHVLVCVCVPATCAAYTFLEKVKGLRGLQVCCSSAPRTRQ